MGKSFPLAACLLLAACGQSSSNKSLGGAAEQSDPSAAKVLEGAAANGTDPQQALQEAGNAAAQTVNETNAQSNMQLGPPSGSLQARPNALNNPNPRRAGAPPEKTVATVQQ